MTTSRIIRWMSNSTSVSFNSRPKTLCNQPHASTRGLRCKFWPQKKKKEQRSIVFRDKAEQHINSSKFEAETLDRSYLEEAISGTCISYLTDNLDSIGSMEISKIDQRYSIAGSLDLRQFWSVRDGSDVRWRDMTNGGCEIGHQGIWC